MGSKWATGWSIRVDSTAAHGNAPFNRLMEREELASWLRLTLTPGVGNETARKLLAAFGLPDAVFRQPAAALRQVASPAQTDALRTEPPALAALWTAPGTGSRRTRPSVTSSYWVTPATRPRC